MYSRNHDKLIFIFIDAKNNPESRKQILLQLIKNHSDISAKVNKGINHEIWNYPSQHTPHFLMKSTWSVRTQQQGERAGMRGERDTKGGKCCRFPSRCTSNPQAWALKTSAHKRHKVNIQRETGHMANRRTHLRHSSTYVSNYKYMFTQMWKTHSLNTYTSINSTESLFTAGVHVNLHKGCW